MNLIAQSLRPRDQALCLTSPDCVKILDSDGMVLFFNEDGLRIMEIDSLDDVKGLYWPSLWPEDLQSMLEESLKGAQQTGVATFVAQCPTAKGTLKWWEVTVASLPFPGGQYCVISRDITDRLSAEEEKKLLLAEMSHRVKNTLTVVQAIAEQSLAEPDHTSVKTFKNRLSTLSSAHDMLLQSDWSSTSMRSLVERVLRTDAEGDRFDVRGEDLSIGPHTSLSISLLLHELATNSVKYGALSVDTGKVLLDWTAEGGTFTLCWVEQGGPPAKPPTRRGFGSRLIGLGIANARHADLTYGDDGLHAKFEAPLDRVCDY